MVRRYCLSKEISPSGYYLGGLNSGRVAALYVGRLSQAVSVVSMGPEKLSKGYDQTYR